MKYKFLLGVAVVLSLFSSLSCSSGSKKNVPERHRQVSEETLIKTNRYLVEKDEERIRKFIRRHGWHMQKTGTGLWYEIYHHGTGPRVTSGKKVTILYTVRLLDGTLVYSSEESGPKVFTAGHGGVESGLEQGILLLRGGDKARFILPPLLAYGVPGDHKKIPPRSVIIYDLAVTNVE